MYLEERSCVSLEKCKPAQSEIDQHHRSSSCQQGCGVRTPIAVVPRLQYPTHLQGQVPVANFSGDRFTGPTSGDKTAIAFRNGIMRAVVRRIGGHLLGHELKLVPIAAQPS